jgi:hypothetical protein
MQANYSSEAMPRGTAQDAVSPQKTISKPVAIAAITIGSGLELYESVVYNFFASLIGPLYFPT